MVEETNIDMVKKKDRLKNIIIILFVIEQFVIIYVISTRKGEQLVDWFFNLF